MPTVPTLPGITSQMIATPRIKLHVLSCGEGAPVIFLHGNASSATYWEEIMLALPAGFRAYAPDLRGYGDTEDKLIDATRGASDWVDDILGLLDALKIDKAHVVGHSMGGTIGMMLAARHPEAVGRLMVVDMIPFMGAMFGPPGTTAQSVVPVADQVFTAQSTAPRDQYLTQARAAVTGMIKTEAARPGPLADVETSDQQVSASAFRELIVTDLRPELSKITAPTEVLYVKFNDPRMTNDMVDGIYRASFRNLPGATLKRIDDSAHFIMLDQPARFEAEVNAFLD